MRARIQSEALRKIRSVKVWILDVRNGDMMFVSERVRGLIEVTNLR